MIEFDKVLNPEQCAAATAGEGPLLVLAAAGTGKTRTLVHRVAFLVEQGVPPERILLLTFTNRAAREMLDRAAALVPGLDAIWSGTFHHVCARFLRRFGSKLGYKPGFQILDEDDAKKLIGDCIKQVTKTPKDFPKKEVIAKLISDAANREIDFRTLVASRQSKESLNVDEVVKVGELYAARKRALDAMDFDDLLVNGLKLLKECDDVRDYLQEHFLHVLVDEYQDTNSLQAQFTDILAARHRNILVVGDDFQCIYTWRGAKFENIMRFPERWPGCRILKLERNYRSLAPILDVANVVMKDVEHTFEKTLRPYRTGAALKPQRYTMWDSRAQADTILQLVNHLHQTGIKWDDIAILYRSHFSSIDIQMTLTRAHVPFQITSGVGVFEQLHVKDVLAFLRLAVDPHAELSFMRLMCLFPSVGEGTAKKWWQKLGGVFDGTNPMDRLNLDALVGPKARDAWAGVQKAFSNVATHLAAGADRLLIEDFVHFFYGDHLNKQFDENEAAQRLDDLNELTAQIATAKGGLKGFLAEVALMTNLDARAKASLPADHMHLTTIHQAKGMEWPVVILPWLVEGMFPSPRAVEEGNISEERRLFYVAVTRAKNLLYLMTPKSRKTADGGLFPVEPSIFMREIPKDLYSEHEVYSLPPENFKRPYGGDSGDSQGGWGRGGWGRGGGKPKPVLTTTWRR